MKRPFTRTVTNSITYNAITYTVDGKGKPEVKILDTFTLEDEITASEKRSRAKALGDKNVQFVECARDEELREISYDDFMKYSHVKEVAEESAVAETVTVVTE